MESSIPEDVAARARSALVEALEVMDAGDRAPRIEAMVIAPYRLLFQLLPLRVYLYDLGDRMGLFEWEQMLKTNRPRGSVLDTPIWEVRGHRFGVYLYSLQPIPDYSRRLASHHGVELPEGVEMRIVESDTPEGMAAALIADSRPPFTLDQLDISTDDGFARLLRRLVMLASEASLERDEIVGFVERNRAALTGGRLELLTAMADAAAKVGEADDGSVIKAALQVLARSVDQVLRGKPEQVDVKSDRLLWLVYALADHMAHRDLSLAAARAALDRPENRRRISPTSLRFMVHDYISALGEPQEPPVEMMMLIVECGILGNDPPPVHAGLVVLARMQAPRRSQDVVELAGRAAGFLRSRGVFDDDVRAAVDQLTKARRVVPDDDL